MCKHELYYYGKLAMKGEQGKTMNPTPVSRGNAAIDLPNSSQGLGEREEPTEAENTFRGRITAMQ